MIRRLLLAICCTALLAACGGEEAPVGPGQPAEGNGQNGNGAPADPAANATGPLPAVGLQRVFPNVTINEPTGLYQAPDGTWWATDQTGKVLRFENSNAAQPQTVLDITDRVSDAGNEEGLLGLAFAPDFVTSRVLYLYYSAANPRRSVLSRFVANGPGGTITPASEAVIMTVDQPFSNHNGGQIAFGPDGFLYIALGDGGSGNDPQGNGQNLGTLLGSILRIDVSRTQGNLAYAVPADNPFAGRSGARAEIWAYGLRNPWRFSFDRANGQLWAADVGQSAREEVNLITRGGNYGWAIMEGNQCLQGNNCDRTGLTLPIIDYARAGGRCSVTGGFVYRGGAIPALQGAYVYGDFCSGEVFALRYDGERVTEQDTLARLNGQLSTFAQDAQGEIYALSYGNGAIFKLVPR